MFKKLAFYLCSVICGIVLLQASAVGQTTLRPYGHRLAVTPHPQAVFNTGEIAGDFTINENTTIQVLHEEDMPGAELIAADVKYRTGFSLKTQKGSTRSLPRSNVICITRVQDNVTLNFPSTLFSRLDVQRAEGYSLLISANRVLIRAYDARGAIYGVQTLRQLIRHDLTLPNLAIRDWPEMPKRMVSGLYNGPFQNEADIDGYVDRALLLKYNAIVFESNWNAGQNWWYNHRGERQKLAKYFQDRCRKFHIDFIPLVQGPGWGYGITDQAPMLSAGEWIQGEKQALHHNTPTALAQTNVVTNEAAPIVVTGLDGKTRYQQDKDFKVLPGKTIRPYEQNNAPWQLQAIAGGAIRDAEEVLVSYNAVTKRTPHQAWNLSDPQAYKILDDTLDTVQRSMNPEYIHIGHDEIWQLGKDSRDIESGLIDVQLVQRDLMHWYRRIKQNNPKTTILMWDDLLRPVRQSASNGILNEVAGDIPKDIVIVPWYYYSEKKSAADIEMRVKHLATLGFSFIGAPAGYFRENSYLWYKALQPYLKSGRAQGMMFTSWDVLHRGDMCAAADLMWAGQKVDRNLYRTLDAITERVKKQGIVLTLAPRLQTAAYAKVIADGLKNNKLPEQVAEEFVTQVIGNTASFQQSIGVAAWDNLAHDAAFPEQEIANLKKTPLFLRAMADYVSADSTKDRPQLQKVIDLLHDLNYISSAQRDELTQQSQAKWPKFRDLFGVDLPTIE